MIQIHDFYDDREIASGEDEQELIDTWHLQAKDSLDFILDELSDEELEDKNNIYYEVTEKVSSFEEIIDNISKINDNIDIAYINIIRIEDVRKNTEKSLDNFYIDVNAKIMRE